MISGCWQVAYAATSTTQRWPDSGFALADDEVVQYLDLNAFQQPCQFMGQYHVAVAGLGATGWMVVYQNDGGTVVIQCPLHHAPRIDRGAFDSALKQGLKGKDTVLAVEKQHGKHFVLFTGQFQTQVVTHVLWVYQTRPVFEEMLLQHAQGVMNQMLFLDAQGSGLGGWRWVVGVKLQMSMGIS